MSQYKSFADMDIPKDFDYDENVLKNNGYQFRGRFNKMNLDFNQRCEDLKKENKNIKIVDQKIRGNMVDLWAKNKTN